MTVEFARPMLLMLLWPAPLLLLAWAGLRFRAEQRLNAFMAPGMQLRLRQPVPARQSICQAALAGIGLAFLIVAAAGPRGGGQPDRAPRRARDIVVALDVSQSMLATDVHPDRLQRAKRELTALIAELEQDRLGLLAFRRDAALLCPLTYDRAFLNQALEAATPDSAPRGATDIGAALMKAMTLFAAESAGHRAVLLVSDGENLAGRVDAAVRAAVSNGVPVFTAGVGRRDGSRIPVPTGRTGFLEHDGRAVVTRLDEATLRDIAAATGGAYLSLSDGPGTMTFAARAAARLRAVPPRDTGKTDTGQPTEYYQWVLLPALLAWLLTAWIGGTPPAARPAGGSRSARRAILIALASAAGASAAPGSEHPAAHILAREALTRYRQGRYTEAADQYRQAAARAADAARDRCLFNAAAAQFAAGDYDGAAAALARLTPVHPREQIRHAMAMGCALFRKAQTLDSRGAAGLEAQASAFRQSAEWFQAALRADPTHQVAGANLAAAARAFRTTLAKARDLAAQATDPATPAGAAPPPASDSGAREHTSPDRTPTETGPEPPPAYTEPDDNQTPESGRPLSDAEVLDLLENAVRAEQERARRQAARTHAPPGRTQEQDW